MIFIIGIRDIKTRVKNGLEARRYCDRCRMLSDMREHRWTRFITLFFIPLIPISKGDSALVCNRCEAAYHPQSQDRFAQKRSGSFSGSDSFNASKRAEEADAEKTVIVCDYCKGRLRIPVFLHKQIHVTCPHCGERFDVKLD